MPDPASQSQFIIGLMVEDPAWRDLPTDLPLDDFIESLIRTVLSAVDIPAFQKAEAVEVSVVLMDDVMIRNINAEYRGHDKATNVLSFPQFTPDELKNPDQKTIYLPLGDILMARETIIREAEEQQKNLEAHIAHMIIHGTLHLLGYDHESDEEAEEMEHLERTFMLGLGFPDPYQDHSDQQDETVHA